MENNKRLDLFDTRPHRNISSATSHTDVIDILVNFTKFGTLN